MKFTRRITTKIATKRANVGSDCFIIMKNRYN
jgi:hypothetical protein